MNSKFRDFLSSAISNPPSWIFKDQKTNFIFVLSESEDPHVWNFKLIQRIGISWYFEICHIGSAILDSKRLKILPWICTQRPLKPLNTKFQAMNNKFFNFLSSAILDFEKSRKSLYILTRRLWKPPITNFRLIWITSTGENLFFQGGTLRVPLWLKGLQ